MATRFNAVHPISLLVISTAFERGVQIGEGDPSSYSSSRSLPASTSMNRGANEKKKDRMLRDESRSLGDWIEDVCSGAAFPAI